MERSPDIADRTAGPAAGASPSVAIDAVPAPADPGSTPATDQRPRASGAQVLLATLASLLALWATREVLIPLLLAMFFALIGNPIIRGLKRMYVPRFVGGLLVIGVGLGAAGMMVNQLAEPASVWVHQAPAELHQLAPKLRALLRPVQEANTAAQSIAQAASSGGAKPVQVIRTEVNDPWSAFLATPRWIAAVLAVVLLTYFFMVYGEDFQKKAIAMLSTRQQKRVTADILMAIEIEVSRYVLTITVINFIVGALLAGILFAIGLPLQQALLWGTAAAILNFAPYVGPMIGVALMLLMGFVTFQGLFASLLPAMVYLGLHVLEGEIVTPIILGRRMAISPLVLILSLMVCSWLWSVAGLLLAVPMMVCVKIVLSKLDGLTPWANLLE
jgi:predicted PurR-regulated permease PerM